MEPRVVIHSDRIHIRDVVEVNKRKVYKRPKACDRVLYHALSRIS